MRLVEAESEFIESLDSCKREALSSFNNDIVILEKFIANPRHIEVQVFGDSHGNAVYLFERDCSIQRRHQKIVEEAPAPNLKEQTRLDIGQAAVKAVKALSYENAGTVEFIMDSATEDFYFMEMNTRLQVEHPVTEEVTGQDLVEWQLKIADGLPIPLKQEDILCKGHAIEVRLYAEDPGNEFLPQTGLISQLIIPPGVRLDKGIDVGDVISIFYDPMFAKLIVHADSREQALQKMLNALNEFGLSGLNTNQEFLRNIFLNHDFIKGKFTTNFISEHFDELLPPSYGTPSDQEIALAAIYFNLGLNLSNHNIDPWNNGDNWRLGSLYSKELSLKVNEEIYSIHIKTSQDKYELKISEEVYLVDVLETSKDFVRIRINNQDFSAFVFCEDRNLTIFSEGRSLNLHLYIHGSADDNEEGDGRIITPMPGKIIDVLVQKGDKVNKDQPLLIMEAMKMEMTIRAGCSGVIEELPVSSNDQVSDGTLLVSINSEGTL
jgi:3-methylcrotonyl-CoA carboxylase alpha subunit